jgi:hypothetical protein
MEARVKTPASTRRRRFSITWLPLIALLLSIAAVAPVSAQPRGNAANTHEVDFGTGGRLLGSYVEVGRGAWDERNAQGVAAFHFRETRRDEWSIYLFDASRKMDIEIDLYRNKIIYNWQGGQPKDLYDILPAPVARSMPEPPRRDSGRAAEVTGYNLLWFKSGSNGQAMYSYQKAGANNWEEVDDRGVVVHTYRQTGQSAYTLTLSDPSRNMTLELDLQHRTVLSVVAGRNHQNQYDIVSAGSEEMRDNRGGYDR